MATVIETGKYSKDSHLVVKENYIQQKLQAHVSTLIDPFHCPMLTSNNRYASVKRLHGLKNNKRSSYYSNILSTFTLFENLNKCIFFRCDVMCKRSIVVHVDRLKTAKRAKFLNSIFRTLFRCPYYTTNVVNADLEH